MSDLDKFDKIEWMEENDVVSGKHWSALHGRPKMEFCDIRLRGGREIGPCWPNDGNFIDLSSDDEDSYSFRDVTHVKYYHSLDEELDDELDEVDNIRSRRFDEQSDN